MITKNVLHETEEKMKKTKLTQEEKELEKSFEKDEWKSHIKS